MVKIENVLDQFDDFELAFIVKYKFDSYLDITREKIIKELNNRNLTKDKILNLIKEREFKKLFKDDLHCPRCTSVKLNNENVHYWSSTSDMSALDGIVGKQEYREKITCLVCDYVVSDPNYSVILNSEHKILNFIKKIFNK